MKKYLVLLFVPVLILGLVNCKGAVPEDEIEHDEEVEEEGPMVFFFDDFEDNSNGWMRTWDTEGQCELEIEDGEYYFEHKAILYGGWEVFQPIGIDESRDYEIETRIKKVSGDQQFGFGLMIGHLNSDNSYAFTINALGNYAFEKWEDGEYELLADWAESEHITKGNGAWNVLTVRKSGDRLVLLANEEELTEIDYPKFFGSNVGFTLYDKQAVSIDYLQLTYID